MRNIAFVLGDITAGAGTERTVTNLANALKRDGNQVSIISIYTGINKAPYYSLEEGIQIIHLNIPYAVNIKTRLKEYLRVYKKIKILTKQSNIEYILGTTHAINCILSFLPRKIKKIGCEHMNYNAAPRPAQIVRKNRYKKLDAVVLLTQVDRKRYDFLPESKTYVIPNIRSFKTDKPALLENKRIISTGRLEIQKGYDILVEMVPEIKKRIPDWKIDIFGSGSMKQQLVDRMKELNIQDYIHINDPVKGIRKEFEESGMFLATSRFEGLPMVMLEAQGCGLPIVSFNCPEGPADIISDGVDGFLIEDFNREEMIDKITRLALNDELRKEMGLRAYKRSDRFSEQEILKKWYKCFEEIY